MMQVHVLLLCCARCRLYDVQKRNSDLYLANHKLQADSERGSSVCHGGSSSQGVASSTGWQYHQSPTPGGVVVSYDVLTGDHRPATLVRRFGELYSTSRLDTLDALDAIPDLKAIHTSSPAATTTAIDTEELKNKLLFSVVVVSRFYYTYFFNAGGSIYMNYLCALFIVNIQSTLPKKD